ncbi:radical SAM protein [Herbaspirillum sp. RV1423]|uniref:radical SAM protein n=1 Tax=Herbaspirillum sp. RV1423 TaxID=1443993 RepID=UPI0004B50C55|nr:radical SAM protein [Herbaspirillum sp. RV1423]
MQRKIFLSHNACLNASYDLNVLKAGFIKADHIIVSTPEEADEIIFSGCSVRDIWVTDAVNQIDAMHLRAPSAKITVTGCVANASADSVSSMSLAKELNFLSHKEILTSHTGLDFDEVDQATSQDSSLNFEGTDIGLAALRQRVGPEKAAAVAKLQEVDREFDTDLERLYKRTTKGFVFYNEERGAVLITVTRSCLYKCSFCNIPKGRGEFTSVSLDAILKKAKEGIDRGIRHLILVGDEIGNYGLDTKIGLRFSDLLTSLINLHPELRLSIRYIEPKPFLKNAVLLKELSLQGRLELLYVSLQSGSQRILTEMNRGYNINKVTEAYASFRETTDTIFYCNWMVGFPGETEEDFAQTIALVKRLDLHINVAIPFSVRPGTPVNYRH